MIFTGRGPLRNHCLPPGQDLLPITLPKKLCSLRSPYCSGKMDKVLGHVARQAPPPIQHPPAYYREDVGPRLLAIDCTLFGVAMITVLMRIYVRVFMLKTFGIDGMSPGCPLFVVYP